MHAPSAEFTRFLEWQTVTTLRRSERFRLDDDDEIADPNADPTAFALVAVDSPGIAAGNEGSGAWPRFARIIRIAAIVLFSMTAGAAGVVAAERARDSKVVERLLAAQTIKITLEEQRLAAAKEALAKTRRRVEAGYAPRWSVLPLRENQAIAEEQLALLRMDAEEIRVAGREPLRSLASPVVAGRDFVEERLLISLEARRTLLGIAEERFQLEKRLVGNGLAPFSSAAKEKVLLDLAGLEIDRLEGQRKLRKAFVEGEYESDDVVRLGRLQEVELRGRELEVRRAHAAAQLETAEKLIAGGLAPDDTEAIRAELARIDAEVELNGLERSLYEGR
ncbi:hypothetical protein [Planctomycetes bacterium Poly30]